MSTDLVDLLPHAGGDADQVVVAQTLEEGQAPYKLEGARTWRMPHHKLHTHMITSAPQTVLPLTCQHFSLKVYTHSHIIVIISTIPLLSRRQFFKYTPPRIFAAAPEIALPV